MVQLRGGVHTDQSIAATGGAGMLRLPVNSSESARAALPIERYCLALQPGKHSLLSVARAASKRSRVSSPVFSSV